MASQQEASKSPTQLQIDFLNKRLDELERQTKEKYEASERAINKAADVIDKRFEGVNEFRETLVDQNANFVRSVEYQTAHTLLVERINAINAQVVAIDTTIRNKIPPISGPSFLITAASVIVIVIISIVTGAIKLGEVQTHVIINTEALDRLVVRERESIVNNAKQDADLTLLKSRLKLHEDTDQETIKRLGIDNGPLEKKR